LESWLEKILCLPTLSFLQGQREATVRGHQRWCYLQDYLLTPFYTDSIPSPIEKAEFFLKEWIYDYALMYSFIQQIFTKNILCCGLGAEVLRTMIGRLDKISQWLML
jgi:hypothetical protein